MAGGGEHDLCKVVTMTKAEWAERRLKLCNCAWCGCLLYGMCHSNRRIEKLETDAALLKLKVRGRVARRVLDRPYCKQCLEKFLAKPSTRERVDCVPGKTYCERRL